MQQLKITNIFTIKEKEEFERVFNLKLSKIINKLENKSK
jgi:hypothetical protein